ncbi:MAG TPA: hypothetical protein VKX49_16725 [Bryobacteraceae bacterium]|nr:hypothetical protein [Bryobacteraceae bacterium]
MRSILHSSAVIVCFAAALPLPAQTPSEPPAVLRIIRESIKEGKSTAHRNSETAFMLEAARLKYPTNIIGMSTLTGASEAWFLEAHDSFAAIESTLAAFDNPEAQYAKLDELDAEFRTGSRVWIAIYRPDLSFHGQELMQNLPKARFMNVTLLRVHPGHESDFGELARMAADASQKAMASQPVAVYQPVSGSPAGTYIVFEPAASLKNMDGAGERDRAMLQAMGDSTAKRFTKSLGDTIASEESLLFSIEPRMSYVSRDFAAADPAFWNPKSDGSTSSTKARPKTALKPVAK